MSNLVQAMGAGVHPTLPAPSKSRSHGASLCRREVRGVHGKESLASTCFALSFRLFPPGYGTSLVLAFPWLQHLHDFGISHGSDTFLVLAPPWL